ENNGEASIFSKIKSLFSKDREQKTPVPPALKLKKEKGNVSPPAPKKDVIQPPSKILKPSAEKISIKSLAITSDRKLESLKEGDKVVFKASLLMSDGSTQIPPKGKAQWTVLGQIGIIGSDGIFTAKLADEIAEYGEGVGAIVATYTSESGDSFIEKTGIFKVEAFVPENLETNG
ncbi:MAG: hypothetical protein AAB646_03065, partial [Patescibacteria group bacterium]